ncbi:MAG TPA: arylsulfatase, partial [Plesiomonas shigelloides]|nr:arylsulfatase [Plesiomonas shigelloides]
MGLIASKKSLIASMIAASLVAAPAISVAKTTADQPNVLLIIMDDLGTGQLDFAIDNLNKEELAKRPVPVRYQG